MTGMLSREAWLPRENDCKTASPPLKTAIVIPRNRGYNARTFAGRNPSNLKLDSPESGFLHSVAREVLRLPQTLRTTRTTRLPMTQRVYNFSAGPAVLPEPVLAEVQRDLMSLPGVGASILEISHRSSTFENIIAQAETNLRELLQIPEDYAVLMLQGGARLQFSMIPMNLMGGGRRTCDYLVTGSWSKYAAQEAVKFGETRIA